MVRRYISLFKVKDENPTFLEILSAAQLCDSSFIRQIALSDNYNLLSLSGTLKGPRKPYYLENVPLKRSIFAEKEVHGTGKICLI